MIMRAVPSFGFVYLLGIGIGFLLLISWAGTRHWYEGIRTDADRAKRAAYLEKVAEDFPANWERIAVYEQAAQLRRELGQSKKAIKNLEKANALGSKVSGFRTRIVFEPYKSGQSKEAVEQAKKRFAQGDRDWATFSIILRDLTEHPVMSDFREQVMREIGERTFPGKRTFCHGKVVTLGFAPNLCTFDENPGFIIIAADKDKALSQKVVIGCYAKSEELPLTASLSDGERKLIHSFYRADNVKVALPEVPAGETRLFVAETDGTWAPGGGGDHGLGMCVIIED